MTFIKYAFIAMLLLLIPSFSLQAHNNAKRRTEAINDLNKGKKLLEQGKIISAEKCFADAVCHLDPRDKFQKEMRTRIKLLMAKAKKGRKEFLKQKRIAQYKIAAKMAHDDMKRREKLFGLRRDALVSKMEMHIKQKDYSSAERLGKEILKLDPNNKNVKQTVDFASQQVNNARRDSIANRKADGDAKRRQHNDENYIIQTDVVKFPEDFKKRAAKRKSDKQKNKKEESWRTHLRAKLQQSVKYDFEAQPISEVIRKLEIAYEVAIVVDKDAWRNELGEGEVLVDLQASRLSLETALYWIFQPFDLKVGLKYGTIYVAPGEKHQKDKRIEQYDVRDLVLVVKDFPGIDISLVGDGSGIQVEGQDPEYEGLEVESIVELLEKIIGDAENYE